MSAHLGNPARRSFLGRTGAMTGLVVAFQLLPGGVARAFKAYPTGAADMPHKTVTDPLVFVAIAPDGMVTITAHRAEMGTGSRTSLPMVLADEMEIDGQRVPRIFLSAHSGEGLPALREVLAQRAAQEATQDDGMPPAEPAELQGATH